MPIVNDIDDPTDAFEETTVYSNRLVSSVYRRVSPFVLEQVKGPGAPATFVLDKETLVLGRSSAADLQVDSAGISRKHATFVKVGSEFSCHDLESSNGVYLNGVRIHSAVLRDGDQLQLGDGVFIYHEGR